MPTRRRHFLVAAGALFVAGCSDADPNAANGTPNESNESDGNDTSDADANDTAPDCSGNRVRVAATAGAPAAEDVLSDLGVVDAVAIERAAEEGPQEVRTTRVPSLGGGDFVAVGGSYYAVERTRIGTEETPVIPLDVSWSEGQQAPADARMEPFEALSEADQDVLLRIVYGSDGEGEHPQGSLNVQDYPASYPDGDEGSAFTGEVWVRWDGRTYRVNGGEPTTQQQRVYRFEAEEVGTDEADLQEAVAGAYRLDLDGLPEEERAVVKEAVSGSYAGCADGAFALRDRLAEVEALPAGGWYVRFDGEDYVLSVTASEA
ncbi:hypothetical protein [Halomarina ordinaria]|uniref:Lipoprotein n=1 Tax=Halomarina ordinaria TaxID=3033939 RepID=A0ABD5U8G4_9EURY|nr:hypothetical protein [Halomarina sp. PSRA2]